MQTIHGDNMKTLCMIITALFPFLHETKYEAKVTGCDVDKIIVISEKTNMELSLFNTQMLSDEGWNYVCDTINQAESVSFEIDATSQIKGIIPVYLFADDVFINEALMKKGYAYPVIRNPKYKYEKQLEEAYDSTQVFHEQTTQEEDKKRYPLQGPIFLIFMLMIWLVIFVFFLKKRTFHKKYGKINSGKEAQ